MLSIGLNSIIKSIKVYMLVEYTIYNLQNIIFLLLDTIKICFKAFENLRFYEMHTCLEKLSFSIEHFYNTYSNAFNRPQFYYQIN